MAPPVKLPFSGNRLRQLRELNGWTQQDLADATKAAGQHVSRDRISLYELGKVTPSVGNFAALAKTLGCEPTALLSDDLPAAS